MLERLKRKISFELAHGVCKSLFESEKKKVMKQSVKKEKKWTVAEKKKKKSKELGEQICNGYVASSVPSSPTFSPPVPPHVLPSFSDDAATLFPLENDNLIPVGYPRPIMLRDKKITPSEHPWKMQRGQKLLSASRKE